MLARLPRTGSHRVGFWLVAFAFAVAMLGTTLPTPLYPIYQERFGFSSLLVTVIFAVYAGGVIAGLLLFGGLSDELGRRPVLLPALLASAASAVAFPLAGGLAPILAGRVLSGLSAGVFTGTATAALVDLAPKHRRGAATLVAVAANIGGLGCGTLLSGLLAEWAPEPIRLPFAVNLGLLALAIAALLAAPETVKARPDVRLRPQRLGVPAEVRGVFVRAATAGLCAFAVSGVFSAVAPVLLGAVLHEHSHAIPGVLVFLLFAASAVGQLGLSALPDRAALPTGCALLVAGIGLLAGAIGAESLGLLFASAAVAGLGQGLVIGGGLAAINRDAPVERRGETASSFFVVLYLGLAFPVVGVGVVTEATSLRTAGLVFSAAVGALVLGVLVSTLAALRRVDEPA
jgi:MFS family permease